MCGIAGLLIKNPEENYQLPQLLPTMAKAISHRGPDDEGFIIFQPEGSYQQYAGPDTTSATRNRLQLKSISEAKNGMVGFAHRRLSIIAAGEGGYQPMSYHNGRYWIVYNGEIYNYKELRAGLVKKGYKFLTESDTEVLLALYQEMGDIMVDVLEGMWAFAIYDTEAQSMFASRDRVGLKPFYYLNQPDILAFASEQKALVQLPFYERRLNRRAAFDYLVNSTLERDPNGLFDKIMELPPASNLTFNFKTGFTKVYSYYFLAYKPDLGTYEEDRLKTHSRKVRKLLNESVKSHLVSEVPVAASLSGGLDSSSIVTIIDQLMKEEAYPQIGNRQKVFTITFPGSKTDEAHWAKHVVDQVGADWHQITPTSKGFMDNLENLVRTQDIPFLGVNTYSHFALMEAMKKEGIKVTLDGQGADEIFGGYSSYFVTFMRDLANSGGFGNWFYNFLGANSSFGSRTALLKAYAKFQYSVLSSKVSGAAVRQTDVREYRYLRDEFWDRYAKKMAELPQPKILNAHLHSDFTGTTLKTMLRNTDRNSMYFGLESRAPFADHKELVEYLFKQGGIYKIRYARGKLLLRAAMGETLPEKILYRKDKMGFVAPQQEWIKENAKSLHDYIGPQIKDIVDYKALDKDWNSLTANANPKLWRIINLAIWRQLYKI
jgi:asparagine synthase (glutamine-hydrolysing)